jgi:hypothetical protein
MALILTATNDELKLVANEESHSTLTHVPSGVTLDISDDKLREIIILLRNCDLGLGRNSAATFLRARVLTRQ